MGNLLRDVRYAVRQLRKSPGFAITAVLTLALGIGANVVVFSVLNALILKPLNVPHPRNLYNIVNKRRAWGVQSYPNYIDFRDRNTTFSGIAAYRMVELGISKGALITSAFGYDVSGNYFDLLGAQPQLGGFFHASDEHGHNSAPYIVLSNDFWRSRFNGNPRIVGETVELDKHPFTVMGVARKGFHGTETTLWPDFWVPMVNAQQVEVYDYLNDRGASMIWLLGRLKPGVTPQQATDNLDSIARQLSQQYPAADDGLSARLVRPGMMGDTLRGPLHAFLTGIMALALLVLLAACANLGSIFAARAADRSRELAVRLAVGSTRGHILRQLLTESIVVSLLGGIAGTFFATGLLQVLNRWQPIAQYPVHVLATPNLPVYAVALLLSLGSGIVFGLLPARQIWRTDAAQVMKSGASTATTFRRFATRDVLVVVQITLCTLLVTASLVSIRGMQRSLHAPLGFQPQGAVLAGFDLRMAGYTDQTSLPVQKRMIDRAARIPGVTAVGAISYQPLDFGAGDTPVYRSGTADLRPSKSVLSAKFFSISPEYLRAARTRFLAGRDFTWHDDAMSPQVVIVNATFAHRMFGNSSATGQHFLVWGSTPYQIVGVVQDGKYDSLTENPQAAMFFPLAQHASSHAVLVVRSQRPPTETAAALHGVLTTISSDLPLTIQSWPSALGLVYFPAEMAAAALGIMGLLAAMLAMTGIFGMAAYSVSKRMKELGIRIALGAQRVQLMRSALGRPLALLLLGSITGLALGVLASRLLAQIVYEATPRDPLVLAGVLATMAVLGLLATWIPARRALHIDPNRLLREE